MRSKTSKTCGLSTIRNFIIFACLVAFPLMILFSVSSQYGIFDFRSGGISVVKVRGGETKLYGIDSKPDSSQGDDISHDDLLLGGLLASGFDQESCLSRYESVHYRKPSSKKPSDFLLSKLRNYEILHKKCGPDTEAFRTTLKVLDHENISSPTECNYIVWTAQAGLGNRILTMASAFLYALLTNKVLLVDFNPDMADLFCEPFSNTSWLLPQEFPKGFRRFNKWNAQTLGNLLKNNTLDESTPSHVNIFLAYSLTYFDRMFYCDEHHEFLRKVPWLFLRSDEYFIPSFFLMRSFQKELDMMFPDKETVFHHLGRYLFHPSNKAWGLITKFYDSNLVNTEERISFQIRIFDPQASPFQKVMDQILACIIQEKLLPEVDKQTLIAFPSKDKASKAILIASLHSEFYQNLTYTYSRFQTRTGEIIRVYQASHEEGQQFGDNMHNVKAWVEMNLLSYSDVIVTSSGSTFGYVAQGLGGLKPWILYRPENWENSNPSCERDVSMEPCLHIPPSFDCKTKANSDMSAVVSYVKRCYDLPSGLKLLNNDFLF